jgi:hypothetical protein
MLLLEGPPVSMRHVIDTAWAFAVLALYSCPSQQLGTGSAIHILQIKKVIPRVTEEGAMLTAKLSVLALFYLAIPKGGAGRSSRTWGDGGTTKQKETWAKSQCAPPCLTCSLRWDLTNVFWLGCPQTVTILIFAFQVVGIIGMSHYAWLENWAISKVEPHECAEAHDAVFLF